MNEKNLLSGSKPNRPATPGKAAKLALRDFIMDRYLEGKNMRMIKDLIKDERGIKISPKFISTIIAEVLKEWEQNKNDTIAQHKARELEKVNRLELEYVRGWDRSKQLAITRTEEKTKQLTGKDQKSKMAVSKISKQESGKVGDPRFLDGIQWCIEMRCKLLGIEAPIKKDETSGLTIVRRTNFVVRKPPEIPEQNAATA